MLRNAVAYKGVTQQQLKDARLPATHPVSCFNLRGKNKLVTVVYCTYLLLFMNRI